MRRIALAAAGLLAAAALLVAASTAQAQNIPPGNSGADQYAEGVPGADGNNPPKNGSAGSGDDDVAGGLPAPVVAELESSGSDGAEAAAALSASAPERAKGAGVGQRGAGAQTTDGGDPEDSPGSITDFADVVTAGSSDGMGAALPIVLAVVLLGAIALALWRRSEGRGSSST